MSIEQLANIAEVIGLLLVVITLIFLTVQMRQHTKALRSSATNAAHEQVGTQIYRPLSMDATLADIFVRGLDDPTSLSKVETARFFAFWQNAVFTMQNWFYQWRDGALDEVFWTSWSKIMSNNHPTPGFRLFWSQRKYLFSEDFINYCEAELFTKEPAPGYRPLGAPKK
jgi:hypothetical protein